MINEFREAMHGIVAMYLIEVIAMVVVILAIAMDLVSGWRKAKLRGEAHSSYAFSRTITKFAMYEGVMMIACGIDTLIHFVWAQFHASAYIAPIASCVVAIILCFVEIWSMREKADEKTRRNVDNAIKVLADAIGKERLGDLLKQAAEGVASEDKE